MEGDQYFMEEALKEAEKARAIDEVPIGALVVCDGRIVSRAYNRRETSKDPTAHAEILAIREASKKLGRWRLTDCTLYVTIEPCPMCAGAIVNARLSRLVVGARDRKTGACGSVMNLVEEDSLNHRVDLKLGVLEDRAGRIMKDFFKDLRDRK